MIPAIATLKANLKLAAACAAVFGLASVSACQAGKLVNRAGTIKAITAERDGVIDWAAGLCDAASTPFKVKDRRQWGADCKAAVTRLVKFERDTLVATNGILAAEVVAQRDAALRDAETAQANAAKANRALTALRKERANVTPDRVGAAYWGSLNDSAGLRAQDPASP